jgi:hypothetical protein
MAIEVQNLSALVGRFTNSVVTEQANLEAPLIGSGKLKKVVKKDKVGIVNIKAGEMRGVKFLADGQTLPLGGQILPLQGTYLPVVLFGRVDIPRMAAALASSTEDGVDIVMEQMDTLGKTLGRTQGRAVFGSQIGAPSATVTAATTFTPASNDTAPFRVGQYIEVWNATTAIEGTTEADLIQVTAVDHETKVVTFVASGLAGVNTVPWLSTYTIHLRGSKASNAAMVSLADVASKTGALYGQPANGQDWSGNTIDLAGGSLSTDAFRNAIDLSVRRRGVKPSLIVCNRVNERRYSDTLLNNRRFANGKMDAVGDSGFEVEGIPFFLDENCGDIDVYMMPKDDIKLHVFRDFAVDFDGQAAKGMNRSAMMVSDTQFAYDVQVWGAFNLRAERRNGLMRITNIGA